jgi:hypothetical protein
MMAVAALDPRMRPHAPAVLRQLGWQPNALHLRLGLQPPGCLLINLEALYGWVKKLEAVATAGVAAADGAACDAARQRVAEFEERLRGLSKDALVLLQPSPSAGVTPRELKRLYERATVAHLRAAALHAFQVASAPRPASVAGPLTDFHAAPGGALPLTLMNAREVIACRGSARYVSITNAAHALVHDLALFLATTLVVDDAPGAAAWRLSAPALTAGRRPRFTGRCVKCLRRLRAPGGRRAREGGARRHRRGAAAGRRPGCRRGRGEVGGGAAARKPRAEAAPAVHVPAGRRAGVVHERPDAARRFLAVA